MSGPRRGAIAGGAIAVIYVVVAALTSTLSGRPTLPLFEGTGPPAAYQWVQPPCDFKTGNVVPKAVVATIPMNANGNEIGSVTQPGNQAIVTPQPGAIPPHAGAKSVTLRLVPVAPATLGALPGHAVADGNAYTLTVTYDDGTPVAKFVKPVDYLIRAPTLADGGVYFRDTTGAWRKVTTLTTPQPNHYPFETMLVGTFVAATNDPVFQGPCAHGGGSASPVVAIAIAAAAAVLIVAVVAVVVVRRRRAAARPAPRGKPAPRGAPPRRRRSR